MISGGTPLTAKLAKRASGLRLNCLRIFSLTRMSTPAPSEVCELLPAVTLPRPVGLPPASLGAAKAGRSLARPSSEVSARGPSSMLTVRVFTSTSAVPSLGKVSTISIGQISSLNSPAAIAASAF